MAEHPYGKETPCKQQLLVSAETSKFVPEIMANVSLQVFVRLE